jgi:hypothetical protein
MSEKINFRSNISSEDDEEKFLDPNKKHPRNEECWKLDHVHANYNDSELPKSFFEQDIEKLKLYTELRKIELGNGKLALELEIKKMELKKIEIENENRKLGLENQEKKSERTIKAEAESSGNRLSY